MTNHTRGPLVVDGSFICKDWRGELRPIATTHFRLPWHENAAKEAEECAANARLFAVADELLAALREARERMMGNSPAIKALIAKTDAVLAKLEGRP